MEKRVLRTKGMTSMKYGTSSEYFNIVMHHGGFMVNSPRFQYSGKELEEDVGESNETVRTVDHVMEDLNPPVRTEEHVRIEELEPISSDEDSDYVADSGFENSEDDGSNEEGFAHEVHVQMGSEKDMNNLNSDLLSGCPAVTLDDDEVNDGAESLHSATKSDSNAEQNKKPRCPEFNTESDSLNPQF
ncbi:hypothetical protein V6N13_110499 [Hibiscus sabdariffa]